MPSSFLVEWNKGDEREERFRRALKHCPVTRVELARRLFDAWANITLAGDDIEEAAKVVAAGLPPMVKKKK